jgi:benzylsuccinate CoA-transferase BbsE subunit
MSNQELRKIRKDSSQELPLSSYRVLDLTGGECDLCGKILADMGADVIKVEPLDGSSGREIGPFYRDIPDKQSSLYWLIYNANKRSITLDLTSDRGKDIFHRMVNTAQVIIESFSPEHDLKEFLSYNELGKLNPGIIATSITPFGLTGPYKNFKAPDLIGIAMGGAIYLTGDTDLPPVFIGFPQAYLHASAQAAVATLIALWHAILSGEGQQIDVSMQASVTTLTQTAIPYWELYSQVLARAGSYRVGVSTAAKLRQIWRCKDGYIAFLVFGGSTGEKSNKSLVEWIDSEGMADDFLKQMDPAFDMGSSDQEFHDRLSKSVERFFLLHTKAELYEEALKRKIMLYPVSSVKDLLESPQLKARDFWEEVEYPEMGFVSKLIQPGAFAKLSETPLKNQCCAPRIGEHNTEIYKELGLSEEELISFKQAKII